MASHYVFIREHIGYYAFLAIGGWLIVGACLWFMRKTVLEKQLKARDSFRAIDFWVGTAERFVATSLVVACSPYLPAFIGGWVTLKFAANWKRVDNKKAEVSEGTLMALIGSVISFAIAIYVGIIINPNAVTCLTK
jgi:hypothetical protein